MTYHRDAGHGWLEVKLSDIIADNFKPSCYSYIDRGEGLVYLEEDCDAARWMDRQGIEYDDYTVKEHEGSCFIRSLPRIKERE